MPEAGRSGRNGYQLPSYKMNSSGALLHSIVTIANHTMLYTWKLLQILTTQKIMKSSYVRSWMCQLTFLWQSFILIHIIILYILKLHNVICQLHIKLGKFFARMGNIATLLIHIYFILGNVFIFHSSTLIMLTREKNQNFITVPATY